MLPTHPKRRTRTRAKARRLHLERLEARNQPAVVAGAGLAVREFFTYTGPGATGPTDISFGQGGLFGNDLHFIDGSARRVYRLGDANNDRDAADAGEGTLLYQFPITGASVDRPVSLLFGSNVSGWGNDLYLIDDGADKVFRVSDDSGSLVISPLATFPNLGTLPNPTGVAFSPDGQFLLVNDCQRFSFTGGGSDGRIYRVSSSGELTVWATGGNLPNGLWDNNYQVSTTSDGWFTVGQDGINPGGLSQIVQFRDNNGDGDALDVGEGRILVGSNVLGLNKKVLAFDAHDVLYVASTTVSSVTKVYRLEDLNHDGDYFDSATNTFDAGESTIALDGVFGNINSVQVGPDGALYVGAKESARGVVYRVADGQAPATPSTPDLDGGSDWGISTIDNVTANNTPTFRGTAEAGSTVRLHSNISGQIGIVTADASGAWTITATALTDGVHQITATATDAEGNVGNTSAALSVRIDTVAPLISATLDRQAASTGWYNLATGAPTATIFGSDAGGSGVAFVSSPFQFGEGHHLSAPGTVVDVAGNSVTRDIFSIFVDLTPPLISATLDKQPASTGWYNLSTGAPTATIFGSDDGGSGVAFVSSPFLFGEGRNLSAPGTVIDVAGNSVSRDIFNIFVDLTPPLISATLDKQPASNGWYNLSTGAPTATIFGSDAGGSGVDFVSNPFLFGEGRNLSAPGLVIDVAGNSVARDIFALNVDLTPPLISATLDRNSGATGWYNLATGAPTATFSGSDGNSGVASVSSPFVFGQGQHLRATGTATDAAGNSVTDSFFDLLVDLTPPLISATLDKQPASNGWYNLSTGAPTATIFGSDAGGSGVDFVSSPFLFGEGQNLSAPGTVIDVAGNSVVRNIFALFVDLTPPLISATLNKQAASTGWYNLSTGAPTATFSGSDGNSGVASVSSPFVFGEGQHLRATGTATDAAGNSVTDSFFDLLVDLTPPLISATLDKQPSSTGWYNLSTGAPTATIFGSDAGGSGVASVSSPFLFGEGQHLSAPGLVVDVAGNSVARNIFDLFVDLTPPAAPTITSPTNGTVTNSTTLTITGVAEAGSRLEVFDNGNSLGAIFANAQGQWSLTTEPLALGDHVFSAAATDIAGNTGSRSPDVRLTVQNGTGPRVVPISISAGQVNLNGGGALPITILSSASFDVRTLNLTTLRLNGSKATSSSLRDVNGDGRLDLVLQFRREDFVDEYTAAIKKDLADGRLDNSHQLITLTLTGTTKDGKAIVAAAQVDMFMSGKKLQELVGKLQPRKKR